MGICPTARPPRPSPCAATVPRTTSGWRTSAKRTTRPNTPCKRWVAFSGAMASGTCRSRPPTIAARTSDIDEVGDRSHLTFFEMLGNFSIGDYFKAEVIPWALEFSTKCLGLEQERLWITIHESDDEANDIWLEWGIRQERIKRFGDEENW